jgi:hypothetical protein
MFLVGDRRKKYGHALHPIAGAQHTPNPSFYAVRVAVSAIKRAGVF